MRRRSALRASARAAAAAAPPGDHPKTAWRTHCAGADPPSPLPAPQLQQQSSYVQGQAAACASGGVLEPYNPTWAPWPTHSWPEAQTSTCQTMQTHATYIQQNNDATIASLQQNLAAQGC